MHTPTRLIAVAGSCLLAVGLNAACTDDDETAPDNADAVEDGTAEEADTAAPEQDPVEAVAGEWEQLVDDPVNEGDTMAVATLTIAADGSVELVSDGLCGHQIGTIASSEGDVHVLELEYPEEAQADCGESATERELEYDESSDTVTLDDAAEYTRAG